MKTLNINSDNGFLNLKDLPYDCIFNKKVTGCGGTTVVLFNDETYVIAVPTTELIINKTGLTESGVATITNYNGKSQSVFGLFGSFTYQDKKNLKAYASKEGVKKIMCTYDKVKYLSEYININEYRLLIDEYHVFLKAYSYRNSAIDGVLDCFKSFKSYCFMSATPISPDFTPSVLKDAELVEAKWNETDTLLVKLDQTNNPYVKAANYINAYKRDGYIELKGKKSYEAFFFINSVNDIASILGYCNLTNDEVKIVCADNETNRKKLAGYTISNSRSENKPFTFITSKSFEGADYFSDTALCFVVSNSRNKNTLLDISTDIYQIAGRIRTENNPFRGLLIHIFNSVGSRKLNLDITYDEMVEITNKEIEGANELITFVNNASANAKKMAEKMINSNYVMKDKDGNYYLNDMLIKLDLYTYKVENEVYKTGVALRKEYNNNAMITTDITYEQIEESLTKSGKKLSFKDAFLLYAEKRKSFDMTEDNDLVKVQPLIVPAYDKLGEDKVRSLRYVKSKVENALINLEADKSVDNKLAKMITSKIELGFISSKEAKSIIKNAYSELGSDKSAKATDLAQWFNCKAVSKRVDGKVTKGFEIYSVKCVFH